MTPEPRQVSDGVWQFHHPGLDLNVMLVAGSERLVLVDTGPTPQWTEALVDWVATELRREVTDVVVTHWHWDHVFGLQVLPHADLWAHAETLRVLDGPIDGLVDDAVRWLPGEAQAFAAVSLDVTGISVTEHSLDLGGRTVDLFHPGPGHTTGDLVIHISDAGLVIAGDVLEQGAPPQFDDADPTAWPDALDRLLATDAHTFIPGHGAAMSVDEVVRQQQEIRDAVTAATNPGAVGPYPDATMAVIRRRLGDPASAVQ